MYINKPILPGSKAYVGCMVLLLNTRLVEIGEISSKYQQQLR